MFHYTAVSHCARQPQTLTWYRTETARATPGRASQAYLKMGKCHLGETVVVFGAARVHRLRCQQPCFAEQPLFLDYLVPDFCTAQRKGNVKVCVCVCVWVE